MHKANFGAKFILVVIKKVSFVLSQKPILYYMIIDKNAQFLVKCPNCFILALHYIERDN